MSNTTQILFNSPALHSLKRDQLVKLCKIHSIKATGKNVELIEKLKQHALTLPHDAPLSIATRSENVPFPLNTNEVSELGDQSRPSYERSRPSEQWEVVMDNIEEIEEASSAQGSLNSLKTIGKDKLTGEFGTTGGSMSSVGSSLRALASSLGLKRTGTFENSTYSKPPLESTLPTNTTAEAASELTQTTAPYSQSQFPSGVPAPQSDPFISETHKCTHTSDTDVDMEAPVPGQAPRPGVPAPPDARLSLGLNLAEPQTPSKRSQPTTTIRLIPGQHNSYDFQKVAGPTPSTPQLIPFKTSFDLIMSPRLASGIDFGTFTSAVTCSSENMGIYPTLPTDAGEPPSHAKSPEMGGQLTSIIDADGDITMPGAFSSPCTAPVTNDVSNAKMALPSESALSSVPVPFVFGSPLPGHRVSDVQFREAAANVLEEMNLRLQAEGVNPVDIDIIKRFHPGSDAAAVPQTAPAQTGEVKKMFEKMHQAEFDKMEGIDSLVKRKAMASAKTGNNAPKSDVVSKKRKSSVLIEEPRRVPSQATGRASGTRVISNGRRGKMGSEAFSNEGSDQAADADEERGKKRPKMDESSTDVHAMNLEAQKKKEKEREVVRRKLEINKAKRRSSAAAAKQSGRVSIGKAQQKQKPSRFGFLTQAKSFVQSIFGRSKPTATGTSTVTAPTASSKAKAGRPQDTEGTFKKGQKNTTTVSRREPVAGTSLDHEKDRQTTNTVRSRSPPNFMDVQIGTVLATAARENAPSSDVSSIGRKALVAEGKASSIGTRGLISRPAIFSPSAKPSSSRLHAPTASSLAKMNSRVATTLGTPEPSGDSRYASRIPVVRKPNTLTSITNNLTHDAATKLTSPLAVEKVSNKPLSPTPFSPSDITVTENETKVAIAPALGASGQLQRQRTLSGRKPRISRSKVISRLASQRANAVRNGVPSVKSPHTSATGKPAVSAGRTRSSLGIKTNKPTGRSSHSGLRVASGGNDLLMSAKKRARQSEYYARRRSRVEGTKSTKVLDVHE